MRRSIRILAYAMLAFAPSACGGTSTDPGVPGASPTPPSRAVPAIARFVITIPAALATAASRDRRSPQYLSAGTQSIVIRLQSLDGRPVPGDPSPVVVAIGGSQCSNGTAGETCTANVPGYVGTDIFLVDAYGTASDTGTPLSSGTIPAVLTANAATQVTIDENSSASLAPVAAAISLSIVPASLAAGTAGTATVTVNEVDATGAAILGTPFAAPLTLTVPPGATAFALSTGGGPGAASIALSRSSTVTVTYDGTAVASPAIFTAAAAGFGSTPLAATVALSVGTATPVPTAAPTSTPPNAPVTTPTAAPTLPPLPAVGLVANVSQVDVDAIGATSTFLVGQAGFAGPFAGAVADPTIATAAVGADGATFTVTGVAVGTTTVTVTGSGGRTLALPIAVTQTPITVNAHERR